MNVRLVSVFVTVTDDKGAGRRLQKDNFQLKEDGGDQKNIAVFDKESAFPLSIVLAIDTSLSTRKDCHWNWHPRAISPMRFSVRLMRSRSMGSAKS